MTLTALKTNEEMLAVPVSQPILIELPGMAGADDAGTGDDTGSDKTGQDDGAKTLQEQLEAMKAAQKLVEDRAARAEADAATARREATERAREAQEAAKRATALEGDIITGGLSAAQGDLAAAKAELIRAGEAGDFAAMAEAQSKIGRASAQILSLESGAADIAERVEKGPTVTTTAPAAPSDPIAGIDANPNLFPAEKEWLKAHPDAVTDARRNNELGVGYERAIKAGHVRGTPDYFAFLEDFMGYAKPAAKTSDTNQDGTTSVQAPVTRQERDGQGRPQNNRITLSPEQREIARSLGVSDIEYAKQVLAFEAAKKADPEKYQGR